MSQIGEEANAQREQNLNQTTVIIFFVFNGTICIVSNASPDGKTQLFGNGIGKIVPNNRITKDGSKETPESHRKKYTIRFENGVWNVCLGESVYMFDEIFGLPSEITELVDVSFHQFKYIPTAEDETTESFRQILAQLVSAHPDRFCLEDPKKQMEVREGGTKLRIPKQIYKLLKNSMVLFGVPESSLVEHLKNGSMNGIYRGDMDLYVDNAKQAEIIGNILTELIGFIRNSNGKSNSDTYRLYLDNMFPNCHAIMLMFDIPEGSNLSEYYIEVEIKIATEFHKAYKSNCRGYFLGLLLSHFLKISTSGVWLKQECEVIPLNVASFDDFLKKIGINLDGIRTAEEFIERLLASPLISELLTVKDILHIYSNIMRDDKTKHTSKPLREWLHLLLCGLKERFPDQFSSLRSELVQEIVRDEKSGQMIPVWSVRLFVLNQGSENEVQMERGDLFISVSGKKLFVSTGADYMSLIFSEEQLNSDSGKKALPESVKSCSRLFELLKDCFHYLKGNIPVPQIQKFIAALRCESEVCSHLEDMKRKLTQMLRNELMKPLFSVKNKKSDLMTGPVYGFLMIKLKYFDIDFFQFQEFCEKHHHLDGDYPSFVILSNLEIFREYNSRITALSSELSPEEHEQMRTKIYDDAISNIVRLCLDVVKQWTLFFHNSELFWRQDETGFFHIPSQTSHGIFLPECLPYYLGTSVLIEEDPSEPSKGKKKKGKAQGKAQGKPAPEEKPAPEGKPVHVFMDGQSGEVFTMPISE